jgi:hypothetical protein
LALLALGLTARERGEAEQATELLEQSIQICSAIAYPFGLGLGQAMLGLALQDRGQGQAACGDEALAVLRRIEHPWGLLLALTYRGVSAAAQGERTRAAVLWCEALTLARRLGTTWGVPLCLEGLAGVAWGQGEPGRAAVLLGVAAALRASAGAPLPPADRDRYAALVAAVRAALGEDAFTATWAEGQDLPLDAAIAAACTSKQVTISLARFAARFRRNKPRKTFAYLLTGGPRDPSAEVGPAASQRDKPAANEAATR